MGHIRRMPGIGEGAWAAPTPGPHYWGGKGGISYAPNVVWQGTTSNATYCSAANALRARS